MSGIDPIDTAVSLIYETVLDESQWDTAMAALARAFDAPMAAHWRFDFQAGRATEFRGHGHDASVQQRYTGHYHRIDPGTQAVFNAAVGQWCGDDHLSDRRAQTYQEYLVDFAKPSDIGWAGGGKLSAPTQHTGLWFGVQRNFDDQPFGAEGARVFGRVAPHLQRLARIQARVKHAALDRVLAHTALDALKSAVFVLDGQRRIHLHNRAADALLNGPFGARGGRLGLGSLALDERLAACTSLACSALPRGSALQMPRAQGLPLHGVFVPVPARHDLANLFHEPLAMLFVSDPDQPHLATEAYQALFRLTPAEAALVFALVNGRSVIDWAAERGVSVSTVRTQLNAVFAKTGADSQTRLLRLATSLPAVE